MDVASRNAFIEHRNGKNTLHSKNKEGQNKERMKRGLAVGERQQGNCMVFWEDTTCKYMGVVAEVMAMATLCK